MKPDAVTVTATICCCEEASEKVMLHMPAVTPVTVYVADGPWALAVLTVAIPLQVSLSPNRPEYPVSVTLSVSALGAPSPLMFSGFGDAFSAIGVGEGVGEIVAEAVRVVRASGLPNQTDSMFTTIEGDWVGF